MFINTAKNTNRLLKNKELSRGDSDQVDFLFKMHIKSVQFYTKNRNAIPSKKHYEEAANHILESFGVIVNAEETEIILSLFPSARIKLAVYNGCSDTEVRDLISEAACSYFCGSEVPTYGDEVDIERFYKHISTQAKELGFSLKE
jgi:hypothetical protein